MVGKSTSFLQEALETDHGAVALFGSPASRSYAAGVWLWHAF